MNKNVLVFGANGQLGQALKSVIRLKSCTGFCFIFLSEETADITNNLLLEKTFNQYNPLYIINCAAYTQVDLAEDYKEKAYQINVKGVENIAALAKKYNSCLLHISTDFVFDGSTTNLLKESDQCNPINYYGLSKLQGEQEVEKALNNYFIIRTSWLYSEFGTNFVKTMLRLAKEKSHLKVVNDQIGTPTYAVDLANFIVYLIEKKSKNYGIYHYSNEGVASWYDFAIAIFEYASISIEVEAVASNTFKTKAKRPRFSVLDKTKVKSNEEAVINHWTTSLQECLKK